MYQFGIQRLYESSLCYDLARLLYSSPPLPTKRTKELKVICCGIPRSATESLSQALLKLGYGDVSHGLSWWAFHADNGYIYYELAMLKAQNRLPDAETLRKKYFDRLLGNCEATTDIPTIWFAHELIAAYPDAQVILNRRSDVKEWKRSFRNAVLPMMTAWNYYIWSWFESVLFWGVGLTYWQHGKVLFRNDFEANAEIAYREHYEALERSLDQSGRPYLKWSIEQGWPPLCAFLKKPVPTEMFPSGNEADKFIPTLMKTDTRRFAKARRHATLFVLTTFGLIVSLFVYL